jgi:hypothetical protein
MGQILRIMPNYVVHAAYPAQPTSHQLVAMRLEIAPRQVVNLRHIFLAGESMLSGKDANVARRQDL